MSFEAAVHAKAVQLDHASLDMCAEAGSGHPTSAMSLGHIVTVLLYHTMRWLPDHPQYPTSDRLVLSEGHAVPIVYAAFADLGGAVGKGNERRVLERSELGGLRETDSYLDGHPNPREGFPFFDAATGSLGMGLSVAAGLAGAARLDGIKKRVYCVIGDGEAREGQIWEAVDFIMDHQLTAVLPIFNCNSYGQADAVSGQQSPEVLARKLEAYGLDVVALDGHSPDALRAAFEQHAATVEAGGKPMAIVARTIKGWGSPCLQGGGWHGKPASGEKLAQAKEELNATSVSLTSALSTDEQLRIYPPTEHLPEEPAAKTVPSLREAMEQWDMGMLLRSGKLATRRAYGIALRALGHAHPGIVTLDADVRNSTFAETFSLDKELAPRFFECKIAEQNMISVGAGLAATGKVPFCSSFGKFLTRGYDQIEMAMYSGANLKLVGSHCGVSLAADGPSQMSLPDVAWFRSLSTVKDHNGNPGCYLLQPADAYAAYGLTVAMAEYQGLCYMRTTRPDVEFIYDESTVFNLGRFEVLTEGRDLLIVTAGYMVHECNKALDALDRAGIDATLVDLYSIPFDQDALLDIANRNGGNILTVEDNFGNAVGAAVAEACTSAGDAFTIEQMYVKRIPKSSRTPDEILKQCGLHHSDIARTASRMLGLAVSA